jgi:integrase
VALKWPRIASKSRTALADGLASITTAMVARQPGRPADLEIRRALYGWAFNVNARNAGAPDAQTADTLAWLAEHSPRLRDLTEPSIMQPILDAISLNLDGQPAAATTVNRRRMVLHSTLEYAVELDRLPANPLDRIRWEAPKVADTVDRRVVVNPSQARALLDAVRAHGGPSGPALVAFFGCMYFAALRPEEAVELREQDCSLPANGWGELLLSGSAPWAGRAWTDNGSRRDPRQLKHRAKRDTRPVPVAPELVTILREHLDGFGTTDDGRLFRGVWGGPLGESTYGRAWRRARQAALSPFRPRHRWRAGRTTCGTRPCRCGSTRECLPNRSPSGPVTACKSSSRSTPSALTASRRRPAPASKRL